MTASRIQLSPSRVMALNMAHTSWSRRDPSFPRFSPVLLRALHARGFTLREEPFDGLTEVVATYHRALKKQQQPHRPYAIAGYSYGSILAFEVSKTSEANNDTVPSLDSFNLPSQIEDRMRMLDRTAVLLHIAHFCGIITE